jgi:hypothetical protein
MYFQDRGGGGGTGGGGGGGPYLEKISDSTMRVVNDKMKRIYFLEHEQKRYVSQHEHGVTSKQT